MNRTLVAVLRWLVAIALPIAIILLAARIMVNTWYPRFEYAKPDFPPDSYGFTDEQRLSFATTSIDFLNSPEPPETAIRMLSDLRQPGTDITLFNVYELSHMMDVKALTDALWRVLLIAGLVAVLGLAVLLASPAARPDAYAALFVGGVITTGLLLVLIALVLLAWRTFFIAFHDVFFPPGSWTFNWTDSLIRLFPDKFWFDAGVMLVGGALVLGVLVLISGYLLGRRSRAAASSAAVRS